MFVDAYEDKKNKCIRVVERVNRERIYKSYQTEYVFYYEDIQGTYKTMRGVPCKRFRTKDKTKFLSELKKIRAEGKIVHESDINPIFRCLSENYYGKEPPELNIGFFDIESDYEDEKGGFGKPWNPFCRITAITLYNSYEETLYTLVLKPEYKNGDKREISWDEAEIITSEFDHTYLCNDEEQLLLLFLDLIEDIDVLVGFNSEEYDIPYTINRMKGVIGEEKTSRMCLWDLSPKIREYVSKFGQPMKTYDLSGRIHLDFLNLYKKHAGKELPTYKLDYIGEIELGENKVEYDGSLDDLYKGDFKKFIEYSRQDVMLLVKLENKLKYIDLANQIAHMNTVPIPKTMGSVALIEQGIINKAWSLGTVVPEKKMKDVFIGEDGEELVFEDDSDEKAAVGAYVREPVPGIYKMVAAVDINSLYPSTLRSLNIGPETIIAQIIPTYTEQMLDSRRAKGIKGKDLWLNTFASIEYDMVKNKTDDILELEYEDDGRIEKITAKELNERIFHKDSGLILSANGTLFDSNRPCIVAELLTEWYTDRQKLQKKQKQWAKIASGIKIPEGFL